MTVPAGASTPRAIRPLTMRPKSTRCRRAGRAPAFRLCHPPPTRMPASRLRSPVAAPERFRSGRAAGAGLASDWRRSAHLASGAVDWARAGRTDPRAGCRARRRRHAAAGSCRRGRQLTSSKSGWSSPRAAAGHRAPRPAGRRRRGRTRPCWHARASPRRRPTSRPRPGRLRRRTPLPAERLVARDGHPVGTTAGEVFDLQGKDIAPGAEVRCQIEQVVAPAVRL